MLFNLTLARTLISSRLSFLPALNTYSHLYSTMSSSGLPAAQMPPTVLPNQGPPKIHLYTAGTPNGYKVSIMLEELREAYPDKAKKDLSYDVIPLSFAKNEQKSPAFLKINPNGRIPAIVDDNANAKNVFETASILLWLTSQYDTDYKFSFEDAAHNADMLSWIFFVHGGVGPMAGQAGFFLRNKIKQPIAIKRYVEETERLFSVLEDGLKANGDYLVGNKYSAADINAWTWVSSYWMLGIDIKQYPNVDGWIDRIAKRDGVKKGLEVPVQRKPIDKEAQKKAAEDVKGYIAEADKEIAAASD